MGTKNSEFLLALLGKPVRIVVSDENCLPPMPVLVLQEVSSLGIVAADSRAPRFFPWHEIVEIHPVAVGEEEKTEDQLPGVDSEP